MTGIAYDRAQVMVRLDDNWGAFFNPPPQQESKIAALDISSAMISAAAVSNAIAHSNSVESAEFLDPNWKTSDAIHLPAG
jgi:hypothetical protein